MALRGKINVPAAAFAGLGDIVPPAAYERARAWYADRYEIVTMPGGHFMHREHPALFVKELLRLVDVLDRIATHQEISPKSDRQGRSKASYLA